MQFERPRPGSAEPPRAHRAELACQLSRCRTASQRRQPCRGRRDIHNISHKCDLIGTVRWRAGPNRRVDVLVIRVIHSSTREQPTPPRGTILPRAAHGTVPREARRTAHQPSHRCDRRPVDCLAERRWRLQHKQCWRRYTLSAVKSRLYVAKANTQAAQCTLRSARQPQVPVAPPPRANSPPLTKTKARNVACLGWRVHFRGSAHEATGWHALLESKTTKQHQKRSYSPPSTARSMMVGQVHGVVTAGRTLQGGPSKAVTRKERSTKNPGPTRP